MISRQMGDFLVRWDYWFLLGLVVLTIIGVWASRHSWAGLLRRVPVWSFVLLSLITLGSAVLRSNPAQWEHNVFDDEYVHAEVAHNLAFKHLPVVSAGLRHGKATDFRPIWPPGYHFWVGVVLKLQGGYSEATVFVFNATVGTLCVPVAFVLAYALFSAPAAAIFAAAFVGTWPLHLRLSNGASTEVLALLFLMLFAITMILHVRERSIATMHQCCQFGTWTALMRPELFLAAPVTAIAVVFLWRHNFRERRSAAIIAALLCVPLLLPMLHAVFSFGDYNPQRAAIPHGCLVPGLMYWLKPGLNNPLWTLLALGGIGVLLSRKRHGTALALAGTWGAYVVVVAVYRRVDPNLGDLQRYFVLGGAAPLLLAAGFLGFAWTRWPLMATGAVMLTIMLSLANVHRAAPSLSPMAAPRRVQMEWLRRQGLIVPEKAIVFSENPSFVWASTGWDCRDIGTVPAFIAGTSKQLRPRPLILYKGFDMPPGAHNLPMQRTGPMRESPENVIDSPARWRAGSPLAEATLMGQHVGLFAIECEPRR